MKEGIVGVTGSTGFVGRSIVKKLLEDRWKVRCILRKPDGGEALKKQGVDIYKGDITNKPSIDKSFFQDLSYVIHLVGIIKEVDTQTFERVHFQGTKNVVDLAKEAGVKKYVHMSALGTRKDAKSKYHSTKWKAEEYLRKSSLTYTIFRPSIIFGPDDEFINTFIRIIKLSPFVPVIKGGKLQPIYVGDVSHCFVQSLTNTKTDGKTFELGGNKQYTLEEIIKLMMKVLNVKRILIPIPSLLMYPPAFLFQNVLRNPPLTLDQLIMLEEDNVCDMKEVEDVFSFSPLPLEDALKQYLG
ncbi:MAG: complex I NDUFA9 subunit family protein [Candidatus Dadabacteria bacterium]|nr:complex I NDUFA9 subunit family protein [Candidatus Dadabacteria bacterium]